MDGALRVRARCSDGETRIVDSHATAPFHYVPPCRREGELPVLTVVNSSGGVLGGDRLEVALDLGAGAALAVRAQAATKLYRSNRGPARSRSRLRLGERALLDVFLEETIPFAASDYEQTTTATLAAGAVLLFTEIVTAGRIERGECFAFERLAIDFEARASDPAGAPLSLRERYELRSPLEDVASPSILGGATVWGTLYALTPVTIDDAEVEAVDQATNSVAGVRAGATRAPIGLCARALGDSVEAVREALRRGHEVASAASARWRGNA